MLRREAVETMSHRDSHLIFGYCRNLPEMMIYLCAAFYLQVLELHERLFEYTWIAADTAKLVIYQECIPIFMNAKQLKDILAQKHRANVSNIYVCEVYNCRIINEYRWLDNLSVIQETDDIFIYHVKPHEKCCEYIFSSRQPFYVRHQTTAEEVIGCPLLMTLPLNRPITGKEIHEELWKLVHPLLHNQNLKMVDKLPFGFYYGTNQNDTCCIHELPNTNKPFYLTQHDHSSTSPLRVLRFMIIWTDSTQLNTTQVDQKNRIRHISAL